MQWRDIRATAFLMQIDPVRPVEAFELIRRCVEAHHANGRRSWALSRCSSRDCCCTGTRYDNWIGHRDRMIRRIVRDGDRSAALQKNSTVRTWGNCVQSLNIDRSWW